MSSHYWFTPWHYVLTLIACFGITSNLATAQFGGFGQPPRQEAVKMWILGGQTENDYQDRIKRSCEQSIVEVKKVLKEKSVELKPEQEARLDLALLGTTSQFMAEILQYKALTDSMSMNDPNDQQKALQILQPAMMESQQGWYGKGFFEKLLKSILDAQQQQVLADYRRERTEKMHRVMVTRLVADLAEPLALTKTQREQLVELMNKQTVKELPPNYSTIICYIKILRIPDQKLTEFLDAKQAETLKTMAAPYQNIENQF